MNEYEENQAYRDVRLGTESAYRKTCEAEKDRLGEWEFSGNILGKLRSSIRPNVKRESDLVFARINDWIRISDWNCLAAFSGAYDSVARELRFLIEDVAQTVYIDQKMEEGEVQAKVQVHGELDRKRKRGRYAIEKATKAVSATWLEKKMYDELYRLLCGYVHPTKEYVEKGTRGENVLFQYSEEDFSASLELQTEVYDTVLALLVYVYGGKAADFCQENLRALDSHGYENTVKACSELAQQNNSEGDIS